MEKARVIAIFLAGVAIVIDIILTCIRHGDVFVINIVVICMLTLSIVLNVVRHVRSG